MVWLSGCLLALCVLGGLFYACFGLDFVHGVFGHKRIFYGHRILKGMSNVVGLSGMMVAGLFLRRMRLAHGYGLLLGLYLLLAVAFAIVQRMGTGVTHNACFEALIAAAMCAGLAVSYLLKGGTLGRLPPRVTLVGMAGLNLLPVVAGMRPTCPISIVSLRRISWRMKGHGRTRLPPCTILMAMWRARRWPCATGRASLR